MPDAAAQGDRTRLSARSEPTLPELVGAGWRRAGARGRIAAALAAALVVGLVAWLALASGGGTFSYSGAQAPPFSISWSDLEQVEAREGELLRLEAGPGEQELVVRPLGTDLPASEDVEPLPVLGVAAERSRAEIERAYPGARVVLEGRTELAVDRGPEAYQLGFAAPADAPGEVIFGKRLLVPDPDRPGGVEVEITERTTRQAVIEKIEQAPSGFFAAWPIQLLLEDAASVRTEEGLEEPVRSFEFG